MRHFDVLDCQINQRVASMAKCFFSLLPARCKLWRSLRKASRFIRLGSNLGLGTGQRGSTSNAGNKAEMVGGLRRVTFCSYVEFRNMWSLWPGRPVTLYDRANLPRIFLAALSSVKAMQSIHLSANLRPKTPFLREYALFSSRSWVRNMLSILPLKSFHFKSLVV